MSENTAKNPHLFCKITGKSRPTTWAYLNDKANRLGVDADMLINNYVSREAITQLLDGASVEEIRSRFKEAPSDTIGQEELAELIRLNSKAKKAAEKFNVVSTTTVEVVEDKKDEVVEEKPKKKAKKGKKVKAEVIAEHTEEVTDEAAPMEIE